MLLYWYDSRLGCRDFRVNMFSENKSINQKCFQNLARWSRAGVSKLFSLRATYRKIYEGPGHLAKITHF